MLYAVAVERRGELLPVWVTSAGGGCRSCPRGLVSLPCYKTQRMNFLGSSQKTYFTGLKGIN